MTYYAWANHLRGSGHKLLGYTLLAAPSCAAYGLAALVGVPTGVIPAVWASLAVLAFSVLTALKVLTIFKWMHDSDNWWSAPTMAALARRSGMIGFGLMGLPFLGARMAAVGDIYGKYANTQDKASVEHEQGALFGRLEIASTAIHILIFAAFCAWRLYA